MEIMNIPTKEQVDRSVTILTGGSYIASDLLPIIRNIYMFIAEAKLEYEDGCFGTPQDVAKYLFVLRLISNTIEDCK